MPIIDEGDIVGMFSCFVKAQSTEIARGATMSCRRTHHPLEVGGDGEDAAKDARVVTHVAMFTSWDKRNISSSSLYVRVLLPAHASIVLSSMLSLPYTIHYPFKP